MNKTDFPIFNNHNDLAYLDSAATTQKPKAVIDSIKNFYENNNSNIHRGVYTLSEISTKKYNESREKIAKFINANQKEIAITKNATEAFNILSHKIKPLIEDGKNEIVLTEMEHHANLVPWQQFAKEHQFKLKFIPITNNYEIDYDNAEELINEKTAIVSFTHISNVFGTINNIKKLTELAKKHGAISIIDAAQSIAHTKIDVKDIGCDFLVFSGHKALGPFGIGVLYGKEDLLRKMDPLLFGGGMIEEVTYDSSTWIDIPEKFEAGTQNVAGTIAFGEAINYLNKIGLEKIKYYEKELVDYSLEKLKEIGEITIYNPKSENQGPVVSFNLKDIHPHDVASILNEDNIAIRAGHHCCMPLMKKLGISGTCRISFSVYNTKEDIDRLIESIKKVQEVFR